MVLLPVEYRFPYIVRVNSQVTHSDGSVSTATVCGGKLSSLETIFSLSCGNTYLDSLLLFLSSVLLMQ